MLFPTHLVVAVGLGRGRFSTAWILAGAALPDLVDKPLAMAGVIPTYHSVVHSALFALVFAGVVLLARARGESSVVGHIAAVVLGWGSHLVADAVHITINGRPENTVFLLWPVVDSWDSIDAGPGPFVVQYVGTTSFYVEVAIWVGVGALFLRDALSASDPEL